MIILGVFASMHKQFETVIQASRQKNSSLLYA